ncbi:MAG: twin-arginine translocation signal domain-containing protein, partial [Paracoccaceae bacterium]
MQSRRNFLTRSLALGCTAAASPLVTPITLASTPGDARLVVIILRGAMDGLDVVRPLGDPYFAGLRPSLDLAGSHDLNGFFALHPALDALMPLWRSGELSIAHAASTPYRDKRSHFDGQDILETGGAGIGKGGWLNRALSKLPGTTSETAFAVGRENLLLLSGDENYSAWSPDSDL